MERITDARVVQAKAHLEASMRELKACELDLDKQPTLEECEAYLDRSFQFARELQTFKRMLLLYKRSLKK